jgi:mannose-6-phosphate isomerase
MYDYGRGRELHIEKALEATQLVTRAGKVLPREMAGRTILMDGDYFRVERLAVDGSRRSATLPGADELASGLAYLFVATGAARISGADFEAVDLPMGGLAAVPASSPEFVVENLGGLDLVRITPRWPKAK